MVAPARAQQVTLPGNAAWIVDASSQGWRMHSGDDPAFAQPGFDDSKWERIDLEKKARLFLPVSGGRRWYRNTITLPSGTAPVDLLVEGVAAATEVYVDGQRVSPPLRSSLFWRNRTLSSYPLRAVGQALPASVTIAIRSHLYAQGFAPIEDLYGVLLASPAAVPMALSDEASNWISPFLVSIAVFVVTLVFGVFLLGVFAFQRDHREYLWLALMLIFQALSGGLVFAQISSIIPTSVNVVFGDPGSYFLLVAAIEFVYAFVKRRPGRVVRVFEAVLVLTPLLLNPLIWFARVPLFTVSVVEMLALLPTVILLAALLALWYRRGSREAGVLLVPILLATFVPALGDLSVFQVNLLPTFRMGAYRFSLWDVSQALFLFSIAWVLLDRFSRVSRDEAYAAAELESARTVQHLLIPEEVPEVSGYRIESVYRPAQQVGGDFFQILPDPRMDGAALVVLGDVSGKGMPAAMTVSLLVGAVRTLAEMTQSPAEILAGLNRRLVGRGSGFTTCVVLRLDGLGGVTASSAGHLNPYLAGREVALDAGLPLGLSAEAVYTESTFVLDREELLTLLTDGVVEATSVNRQLFGFARTEAISGESAYAIAEAACGFGKGAAQADDITVLTVARA